MFHKNLKLIITALLLGTGIWQIIESYIGNGIMLIVLSFVFVFLYFKNEIILLSFLRLRKQDFPGAKKWLDKIKNPEASLVRKQQGYYNYLNGLMLSQTNMNEAEKYFKKAVTLGLSMDTDMAMTKLNLAGIAMSKNRKREARKNSWATSASPNILLNHEGIANAPKHYVCVLKQPLFLWWVTYSIRNVTRIHARSMNTNMCVLMPS